MVCIITVAQQKGGVGKSTLAAQLAISYQALGQKVVVVDIDPQGSLTYWYQQRVARLGAEATPEVRTITGWRVHNEVIRLSESYDRVIVDSPPHTQTEAKIAIRSADLVLIPLQPSPLDVWATQRTVELTTAEGRPLLAVLNRVTGRAKLVEATRQEFAAHGIPLAETGIANRVAYSVSLAKGSGVAETAPNSLAAEEINRLIVEIEQHGAGQALAGAAA
ncbi:MAG: ParA family protein [Alphaproteobacteria bacterium]|nr:ParA family protein [Alphaproteobacteria bacterium]